MNLVPLDALVTPVRKSDPSRTPSVDFSYIDLSSVDNSTKTVVKTATLSGAEAPSRARQLVAVGDILVSTVRPNLNAVAEVPTELDGSIASTGFTVLRAGDRLDARFLYHWVQSRMFVSDMVRQATGASYPAVSDRTVKASRIPLPPLPEQRRIAAILDHADALRAKRRQVLAHLDVLPQAIFHAMFGKAPWSSTLGDLADVQIGPFGSLLHQEDYVSGGIPVINPTHIQGGALKPDEDFSIPQEKAANLGRYRLHVGDVVLGRRGEMGRAAVAGANHRGMLCGTGSLVLRSLGVDSTFLHGVVTSPRMRAHLTRNALGVTLPNLNAKTVKAAPAPSVFGPEPSMFADRIQALDAQRAAMRITLAADDELFATLQSRAFRGEL